MTAASDDPSRPGESFPRQVRLTSSHLFRLVYREGRRTTMGPLTIRGRPNELGHCRLGFSIPRRVGNAVNRNLIRRRIRETFRRLQHDLPRGYDLVVSVQPHEPLALADYQRLLSKAARHVHRQWTNPRETT